MLVPLWYWLGLIVEFIFVVVWFTSLGSTLLSWRFTVHLQLARDWTLGVAKNRKNLGRRAAVRGVWITLPWLVSGTLMAVVHWSVKSPGEELLFDELLVIQSVAIASIAALCSMSQMPPSLPRFYVGGLGLASMGAGACVGLTFLEYPPWAHAVFVVALPMAMIMAVRLGGSALARAEILSEAPVRLQRSMSLSRSMVRPRVSSRAPTSRPAGANRNVVTPASR